MQIVLTLGYDNKELVQFANLGRDLGGMKMDKMEQMILTWFNILPGSST